MHDLTLGNSRWVYDRAWAVVRDDDDDDLGRIAYRSSELNGVELVQDAIESAFDILTDGFVALRRISWPNHIATRYSHTHQNDTHGYVTNSSKVSDRDR